MSSQFKLFYLSSLHSLLTTTKECFPGSLSTTNGPGLSTVSSAAIYSAFIHKNELVGIIRAYASCKIRSFLSTSLNGDTRELFITELANSLPEY